MLPYFIAAFAAFAVYAALQAAVIATYGFDFNGLVGGLTGRQGLGIYCTDLVVAFLNCSGCALTVLLGVSFTPRLRQKNKGVMAAALSLAVAVMQLACLAVVFSYGSAIGSQSMLLSVVYYGGLLTTGAVCCFLYERLNAVFLAQKREALEKLAEPSLYTQALARLERRPDAQPFASLEQAEAVAAGSISDGGRPHAGALEPPLSTLEEGEPITFFDFDLILLEDELLRMRPDQNAYISAMRLGIAIEKDQGYANCRARNFTFSQLMKDVAMRLSVTGGDSDQWSDIASDLSAYGQVSMEQRRLVVREMELLLLDLASTVGKKRNEKEPNLITV